MIFYSYDIGSFAGLETSTLSKWERNIVKPKLYRQVNILKYFQEKTGVALPCWNSYSVDKTEELICKVGMQNLLESFPNLCLRNNISHFDKMSYI